MLRKTGHANLLRVTTVKGNEALPAQGEVLPAQGENFARAYADLRADDSIQFGEVELPEIEPQSNWFTDFMQWLGEFLAPVGQALVYSWPVLQWVLILGGIGLILYALWRTFGPDLQATRSKSEKPDDWVPDQNEAIALLEEADRLASEGLYDEATHLLLKRSVGQIAAARPEIVEPSSTARELSAEPRIPEGARAAFTIIATRVERSLFALTKLGHEDWQAARDAYAEFALEQKALAA